MPGQADAGQVHVHAPVTLVGPEQLDRQIRLLLVQAPIVIGVDHTHIALPCLDGLQDGGVVGEHVGGEVVHPARDDLFGLLLAMVFDQRGGQRLVVDLLGSAQAQPPFPRLVGQGFVRAQRGRIDTFGGVGDGARAQAQARPCMGRGAVLGRNVLLDHRRLDGLQDAHLLGLPEVAGIDGQQQVGHPVLPLGLDALHQGGFLVGDEGDRYAGLCGVGIEDRLDQLVDA